MVYLLWLREELREALVWGIERDWVIVDRLFLVVMVLFRDWERLEIILLVEFFSISIDYVHPKLKLLSPLLLYMLVYNCGPLGDVSLFTQILP